MDRRRPESGVVLEQVIVLLAANGAQIVDPVEIDTDGMGDEEYEVLLYEFKEDPNSYLSTSGARWKSLEEIIAFNGVSFIGPAYSERQLIKIACAFEQASKARRAPLADGH